jgi:hypothetical protein
MSASVSRIHRPNIVLVGPPRLRLVASPPDVERVTVVGSDGNWQDLTAKLAAQCAPQFFETCGCRKGGCACGMKNGNGNGSNTSTTMGQPNNPMAKLVDDCRKGRWVPITIFNNLLVGAGGAGSVSFQPQAPFKLARMTLSAAQAADFTGITVAVGPTQNVLPGVVDGTYFSVASNQDGDGRIDSPICLPGQTTTVNFTSTAGVAAGAARFTLQGAYAGQLDPHY